METPFRSPKTLSRLAMAALGINGALAFFSGVVGIIQLVDPSRVVRVERESMSVWLMLQGLIALVGLLAYLLSIVLFLVWLYRTYTNLPGLNSSSNEFSPGWAVGWWFVPFANLVKPFQAVRSVWAESDPEIDPDAIHFSNIGASAPSYMAFWWALWIISNVMANLAGNVDMKTDISMAGYLFIVAGMTRAAAAALAIKVVYDVSDRQEQRFARLGMINQYTEPPPPPVFGDPQIEQ